MLEQEQELLELVSISTNAYQRGPIPYFQLKLKIELWEWLEDLDAYPCFKNCMLSQKISRIKYLLSLYLVKC